MRAIVGPCRSGGPLTPVGLASEPGLRRLQEQRLWGVPSAAHRLCVDAVAELYVSDSGDNCGDGWESGAEGRGGQRVQSGVFGTLGGGEERAQ